MNDTICAISTPIGAGGIGIIRLSGAKSLKIAKRIFRTKKRILSHRLIYGKIFDPNTDSLIDEALLCYMKAPKTYTREDVVEINIHSGYAVLSSVVSIIQKEGARLAEPGEFTKRAFLNGRIDLIQAEAVAKIVQSKTELSRSLAAREIDGDLSIKIRNIKENLTLSLSYIEAGLDFEEEIPKEVVKKEISSALKELNSLLAGYKVGRFLSNCAIGVIIGRPNVGKSSILNSIIGSDVAIVTPIPGTTRDLISEIININGILLKIVDTAGLCNPIDLIEKEGVKRALGAIEKADIIIYVLDGSFPITGDDIEFIEKIKDKNVIFAINKNDLPQRINPLILEKYKKPIVSTSSKYKEVSCLLDAIKKLLFSSYDESHIITSIRHKELIEKSILYLDKALGSFNLGDEIVSIELRQAINTIGEILGEKISDEDILDRIFSTFCIGK